jgi:hypothetical protein
MARVWHTGFELGNPEHDLTSFVGARVTPGLLGSSYAIRGDPYAFYGAEFWTKNITPVSEIYFAEHAIAGYGPNYLDENAFVAWQHGSTMLGSIRPTPTTRLWAAYVGNTAVAWSVAPNAVPVDVVVRLDVRVKIADANANPALTGRIQLWADGLLVIDFSGDTKPGADTTIDFLRSFVCATPGGYGGMGLTVDNLMLNDTTGDPPDNGRIGDKRVVCGIAAADGTYTQWTPINAGLHHDEVDERPADDDSTFVIAASNDFKDSYGVAASGLSNVEITRVWAELTAKKSSADGTNQIKPILISGATETIDTAKNLASSYARVVSVDYATDPNTGLPWTVAALDALEVGVQAVI